jgi:hypothetical protein
MSTRPVEPEELPTQEDTNPGAPNPTQLPVEPEFGQALPAPEPEDPGVPTPKI